MDYLIRKLLAITTLVIATTGSVEGSYYTSNASSCFELNCAPPCCQESCGKFFFGADLLILRAYEGGLSSACDDAHITNTVGENGTIISTLKGRSHDPDFNWNAGFRLGLGYEFADSRCGVATFWTHFNSNTHGNHSHRNGHHWKVDFDVVDVLFGCRCDCSSCVVLTPYAGLKFANIDQRLGNHFFDNDDSNNSSLNPAIVGDDFRLLSSRGRSKEDFFGVGPMLGLAGDLNLGCDFSLYGNLSFASLYGDFHVRSHHTDVFDTGTNIDLLRNRRQACQIVVDAGLGVRWKTCYCDVPIMFQLGVEEHRYFNHNQFCSYGDFSLSGVSLGFGLEF